MIEDAEEALKNATKAKNLVMRQAGRQPKKAIEAKLQPIEEEIHF